MSGSAHRVLQSAKILFRQDIAPESSVLGATTMNSLSLTRPTASETRQTSEGLSRSSRSTSFSEVAGSVCLLRSGPPGRYRPGAAHNRPDSATISRTRRLRAVEVVGPRVMIHQADFPGSVRFLLCLGPGVHPQGEFFGIEGRGENVPGPCSKQAILSA